MTSSRHHRWVDHHYGSLGQPTVRVVIVRQTWPAPQAGEPAAVTATGPVTATGQWFSPPPPAGEAAAGSDREDPPPPPQSVSDRVRHVEATMRAIETKLDVVLAALRAIETKLDDHLAAGRPSTQ